MNKLLKGVSFVSILCTLSTPIVVNAETATPVSASSTDTTISYQQTGKLKFNLLNGSLTVIGYVGDDAIIAIPSNYLGYNVTAISDKAFVNDPNLTTLIIPTGITYSDSIAPIIIEGDTEVTIEPSTVTSSTSTPVSTITSESTGTVIDTSTSTVTQEPVDTSTVIATSSVSTTTTSVTDKNSTSTVSVSSTTNSNTSTATSTSTVSKTYDETCVSLVIVSLIVTALIIVGISPVGYRVINKIKSRRH